MSTALKNIEDEDTFSFVKSNEVNDSFNYGNDNKTIEIASADNDLTTPAQEIISLSKEQNSIRTIRKLRSSESILPIPINQKPMVEKIQQQWSGVVLEIDNEKHELKVQLEDLTSQDNPDEVVVISIDELDPKDIPLLKIGAMFFWHMGYKQGYKSPRESFSKISIRRIPTWTKSEITEAEHRAREYENYFIHNSTRST